MSLIDHLLDALSATGHMAWQIGWSLILGFTLAAAIQALVSKEKIADVLPDDSPKTLAAAAGLGAASSSCSYAAVALARTLVGKGANFTSAIIFQLASTNLVLELGIILALLIGWQFTLAEYAGGAVMIVLVAVGFRRLVSARAVSTARDQAARGLSGSMEGHAAMDMSVSGESGFARRLLSSDGRTAVSHIFVMEWAAILRDLAIGLLIAGAASAWIPDSFWQSIFISDHPTLAKIVDPLIGPVVAMLTFVCSIGNVPLAAVLWNGGISFGGVISFLFADLLIIPILSIYRKYYGKAMMLKLLGIFYLAAVLAGYAVDLAFGTLGLVPTGERHANTGDAAISWNYTTILNIIFGAIAALLVIRFLRTGGRRMLTMMGGEAGQPRQRAD
ncbi:permease [Microlunatus ginsengisoli]|uniref:Permease n=1 Tax=Microlunatus ginsengisoli TaxID=363863 RepID=A0ABP6ZIF7_9ACTN